MESPPSGEAGGAGPCAELPEAGRPVLACRPALLSILLGSGGASSWGAIEPGFVWGGAGLHLPSQTDFPVLSERRRVASGCVCGSHGRARRACVLSGLHFVSCLCCFVQSPLHPSPLSFKILSKLYLERGHPGLASAGRETARSLRW